MSCLTLRGRRLCHPLPRHGLRGLPPLIGCPVSALHLPLPVLREPGFGSLLGLAEAVLREPASSRPS